MRVQIMLDSENISEGIEMPSAPQIGDIIFKVCGRGMVHVWARQWIQDDLGWFLIAQVR